VTQQSETVAGHTFTLSRDAVCECGIAWAWLKEFGTRDRVGEKGFAHVEQYTNHEASQVEERRAREQAEDERMYAAIAAVAKI